MSAIENPKTISRNAICCLLALEIADYDARSVFDQIRSTQDLRKLLSSATAQATRENLISIVREDGALLGFLADPQECFTTALAVREAAATCASYHDLPLRMGINLGTVEIAQDEFGRHYMSGEGRRDVERVMRHGPPRQISVARPFFELLSRTASDLSGLLEYQGLFSDTLGPPLCVYRLPPSHRVLDDEANRDGSTVMPVSGSAAVVVREPATAPPRPRPMWLRYALVPLLIGAVLLTAFGRSRDDGTSAVRSAVDVTPKDAVGASAVVQSSMSPVNAGDAFAGSSAAGIEPATQLISPSAQRPNKSSPRRVVTVASRTPKRVPEPREAFVSGAENESKPTAATATVVLAVKPWGEVYVDGKPVGITPPLKKLSVAPGRREITVTNSFLPSYRMQVTLEPNQNITVAHDFDCIPHREKPCRDEFTKGLDTRSTVMAVSSGMQR